MRGRRITPFSWRYQLSREETSLPLTHFSASPDVWEMTKKEHLILQSTLNFSWDLDHVGRSICKTVSLSVNCFPDLFQTNSYPSISDSQLLTRAGQCCKPLLGQENETSLQKERLYRPSVQCVEMNLRFQGDIYVQ